MSHPSRRLSVARIRSTPPGRVLIALVVLALGGGLGATRAVAQGLEVDSIDREVSANGTSVCPCGPNGEIEVTSNGETIPSAAAGLFSQAANSLGSFALQESTVGSGGIVGQGTIETGFAVESDARSRMVVEFSVSQPRAMRLTGSIDIPFFGATTALHVALSGPGGDLFRQSRAGVFDQLVGLEPGMTYRLEAIAEAYDPSAFGSFVGWDVRLVPEPGPAILLGLGLAGLARRRRR